MKANDRNGWKAVIRLLPVSDSHLSGEMRVPKVYIDASVFTATSAFGRVSGTIEVEVIPQVGDLMAFGPRDTASAFVPVDLLPVTHRIVSAGDEPVAISLDDITVETDDAARAVMRFLEESYGLFGEVWGDAA